MYEVTEIEASEDINEEEINSLRILYQTPAGTIPMEREKGIDLSFLSMPVEVAKNMFSVEVIKKTRLYMDLEVTGILFTSDEAGKITAKVVVSRGE
ncbi:MAG: hypothetical protein WCD89_10345 [Anaerocolumna sp.]